MSEKMDYTLPKDEHCMNLFACASYILLPATLSIVLLIFVSKFENYTYNEISTLFLVDSVDDTELLFFGKICDIHRLESDKC